MTPSGLALAGPTAGLEDPHVVVPAAEHAALVDALAQEVGQVRAFPGARVQPEFSMARGSDRTLASCT